jgi:putative spermidine/putrescine transport system permease protein
MRNNKSSMWSGMLAAAVVTVISAPAIVVLIVAFRESPFLSVSGFQVSYRWFREASTGQWPAAIITSIMLGGAATLLATACAAPAAFYRAYNKVSPPGLLVDLGALVLLLVPPISLAVGYFRTYGENSWFGLLLGHTCLAFPFVYFSLLNGFKRLDPELQDAAALLGASPWAILARVAIPASKQYLALGIALAFLMSWDESVLSLFITGPQIETLPKLTWETMQRERNLTAAAINCVFSPILTFAVLTLSWVVSKGPESDDGRRK